MVVRLFWLTCALVTLASGLQMDVFEHSAEIVQCQPSESIWITKGTYTYSRANVLNFFTPNLRNVAFLWGKYIGSCTWDVTEKVKHRCDYLNKCKISPSKNFEGCWYQMYLDLEYECRRDKKPLQQINQAMEGVCHKIIGRNKRQVLSDDTRALADAAATLEEYYTTRTVNMGALTSITTNDFMLADGTMVPMVYVMRARISAQTVQSRQPFPREIAERMVQLNAVPPAGPIAGDERGHLLACSLGGPSDVLNIVPQAAQLNRAKVLGGRSYWRLFEDRILREARSESVSFIDWTLVVNYNEDNLLRDNLRPAGFAVSTIVHFRNGTIHDRGAAYFPNESDTDCIIEIVPNTLVPSHFNDDLDRDDSFCY